MLRYSSTTWGNCWEIQWELSSDPSWICWSLWTYAHKTRGCLQDDILYNIWHFAKQSNANGGLQCTLHIPVADGHCILRVPQKIHTSLSRQYIHILSEHLRAYRAHNESAPMTQRVPILFIKVKTWLILRQDQLSGTCHWQQWHTHWVG